MFINNKNFFAFKPNDLPILLYGENFFAKQTYRCLEENGYNVKGYIDQKYLNKYEGEIIRIGPDNVKMLTGEGRDYIVIICLQNGLQHEKVAEILYSKGMDKIIYLPMSIGGTLREQEIYRRIYRSIQEFHYEEIEEVPVYSKMENELLLIIDKGKWGISFWCPMEYLHSSTAAMILNNAPEGSKKMKAKFLEYADVPIEEDRPYIELFKWLRGETADVDFYLTAMERLTEAEKRTLLADRKNLYDVYEQSFSYNMPFFMDSPARGVWNSEGYFNILDGMHRVQYLYSKGYQKMPIITTAEEYQQFHELLRERK